ncbi:ABC transporter ATP-binding protein [Spiroplasma helicoides]|uniref:ABC transporter ATP-binding protein n=1 Tax=Spiroplasma helicoides TaxID=216938 RepID=A0A1B3SKN8_9MOLU|nr:ABC transporter ATP-binding protein [Spiroplasma helicoides]AOG60499.1 ABC transporter ATP-binding protein [Spiroplasma helicoides]
MIEIINVSKRYGKKVILDNINFTVQDGEAVGILGSNGAGKTTLMEIIVGQIKASSGKVLLNGQEDAYKKFGIQFQEGFWPKGMTSRLLIKYFKKKWSKQFDERTNELIEIFEIKSILDKDLNELSGGQKQRLNTLLAILNNPNYIFLDEMITGLDLKMQLRLASFFSDLKKEKKTLIVISHIPEEVEHLCDRVIIIDDGKIFLDMKIDEVLKKYKTVRELLIKYYEGDLYEK